LELAQGLLSKTKEAEEVRILQAVILPLVNGMSIVETARALGRSPRWTTQARNTFIRNAGMVEKPHKEIRNRAHLTKDEEVVFLVPFFESARQGGVLVASEIHRALERHLGHKVALASAYNLLHRHGWRKLAPDKRHVKTDIQAQEEWKKNFPPTLPVSKKNGTDLARSG
jgi:transposase